MDLPSVKETAPAGASAVPHGCSLAVLSTHQLLMQILACLQEDCEEHDKASQYSRDQLKWHISAELDQALDQEFDTYDLDESGWIASDEELNLLASNVAYMAFGKPFQLQVGEREISHFIDQCLPLTLHGSPAGINKVLFKNIVVSAYGFQLQDGSFAAMTPQITQEVTEPKDYPYGDPELEGFVEWWESDPATSYGPDYLHQHPGEGQNGHDEVTEQILAKAKLEFKAGMVRHCWEMKRAKNMMEWRRCIREGSDISQCQSEEEHLVFEIRNAKMVEKLARKQRVRVGKNVLWLEGASCINDDTWLWQNAAKLRADPSWQWFMLVVNLVNMFGLMSDDTSCEAPDCGDIYQDVLLPVTDIIANVLFTIDMVIGMIVIGFKSYFTDNYSLLDFFVVVTGWLDIAKVEGVKVSALRALRILKPLRLVKYLKGIQAIIGAIYFNLEQLWNVISFMLFFLVIFGITGITLFPGNLQQRCVVASVYPSQTSGIAYSNDYAAVGEVGEMGEFEYFCTSSTARKGYPFPYRCASYMTCDTTFGNPHHGATHFDNFGAAFLLMFQVQTLSTWYEFDYWTQMTIGWYSTVYYQMIIFFVGFIVSQLFIAVVCFGFENLDDQLSEPDFSDAVIGNPYVERELDPDDNLCLCLNRPINPLAGARTVELDRGERTGLRVKVKFLYHYYAPKPLDITGHFEPVAADGNDVKADICILEQNDLNAGPAIELSVTGVLPLKNDDEPTSKDQLPGAMGLPMATSSSHPQVGTASASASHDEALASEESHSQNDLDSLSCGLAEKPKGACTLPGVKPAANEIYNEYRVLMQRWKDEAAAKVTAAANVGFTMAQGSERAREMEFKYETLATWSNERVWSLHVMLRAQEEIDQENTIKFYHDEGGQPGREMENELLSDLMEFQNDIDMPEIVVHVRSYIKVVVEPLSIPGCELPTFSLIGNETIGKLKQMSFEYVQSQAVFPETVKLEHCKLYVGGDVLVDDSESLFAVSLSANQGEFDPMSDEVFFAITIDACENFILSPIFDNVILSIICLNSITLSMDHYDASDAFSLTMIVFEWIFNAIFTIEMFLKIFCLKGFGNYWRFASNKFDFVIVFSSWLNVLTETIGLDLAFIKVLRIFRVLRVTRVLRTIDSVRQIVDAAFNSMQPIMNIMVFMLVVLTVYSCMGMQLYGSKFDFDEVPRENFDNFVMAFLALFQVLTGSAWELVLYDCMRASSNSDLAVPFILSFFVLSNYIVLNLFIGAILANMGTGSDEQRLEMTTATKTRDTLRQRLARESQLFVNNCTALQKADQSFDRDLTTLGTVMQQRCAKQTFVTSPIEGKRFGIEVSNVSLGLFPPYSEFRRSIYNLVTNPFFDLFILIIIVYSTILLTLLNQDTIRDDAWKRFFFGNDVLFLIIFTIEFVLKLIAFGVIWCDNVEFMLHDEEDLKELMLGEHGIPCYMHDPWNYLDLLVLFVSYINMFSNPEGPLKILRLLRAFRPLRMINRIEGLRVVIQALLSAMPALSNVCILLFSVFLIFAILGLSLFMGKFQACNDGESDKDVCYGVSEGDDFWLPMVFANPALDGFGRCSFDNIWDAFMALFEVASGDSWETVMYLMADIPKEAGQAPYRDDGPLSNCLWAFFCVIFVFMGQLFMMQLFVSVIIDSYCLKEGSGVLTDEQSMVNDMCKYFDQCAPEEKPKVPEGCRANWYNLFISARPLPVPEMEKCIISNRIPSHRFVSDTLKIRRKIEATKQSIQKKADPLIVARMTKSLKFMQASYEKKMEDVHIFQAFSKESLDNQSLPPGLIYVCGSWFDIVLTGCIILNISLMCTVHHNQSDSWSAFIFAQNLMFLCVFTVEMMIKMIGLGVWTYFSLPFDAFDGFTVIIGWVFVIADLGLIAGIFRIGRVFRLIKRAPKLKNLMATLIDTLPSISNVFMVLLLVLIIFGVIGVELFGQVRYGFSLNVVANMGTWPAAMHMLWRAALGNWRGAMYDSMVATPDCTMTVNEFSELPDGSKYNDCGNYFTTCFFFVIFQVLVTFCVLNLVVAIILNAFTWCYSLEPSQITSGLSVNSQHLQHFAEIWARFDLFGTGFVDLIQLQLLLSVIQYNIPELFRRGEVNQHNEPMYEDFSSFGTAPGGLDRDSTEAQCRRNYDNLVTRITKYERSLDVHRRLLEDGVQIQDGDNTFIFNAKIDNDVLQAEEDSEESTLLKVQFSTLMMIMLMDVVGLTEHDQYVCHNYRHPFRYRVPGYRQQDIQAGCICIPEESSEQDGISEGASMSLSPQHMSPLEPKIDLVVSRNAAAVGKSAHQTSPSKDNGAESKKVVDQILVEEWPDDEQAPAASSTHVSIEDKAVETVARFGKSPNRCGVRVASTPDQAKTEAEEAAARWQTKAKAEAEAEAAAARFRQRADDDAKATAARVHAEEKAAAQEEEGRLHALAKAEAARVHAARLQAAVEAAAQEEATRLKAAREAEAAVRLQAAARLQTKAELAAMAAAEETARLKAKRTPAIPPWKQWREENRDLFQTHFELYDLDESGTINDASELKFLVVSLVQEQELSLSVAEMDEILCPAAAKIEGGEGYTIDGFMFWLYNEIVCRGKI